MLGVFSFDTQKGGYPYVLLLRTLRCLHLCLLLLLLDVKGIEGFLLTRLLVDIIQTNQNQGAEADTDDSE